jgi:hypothetical protein
MDNMQPEAQTPAKPKTSGLAIASLILALCSVFTFGLSAIVGLILGIVGLSSINKSAGQLKGAGLAIAGIVISAAGLVVIPLMGMMIAILMPAVSKARDQAKTAMMMARAKQLGLAIAMYSEDNDDRLPPSETWPVVLQPYIGDSEEILRSPFNPEAGRAWAMNANLETVDIRRGGDIVLFFEAEYGSPPAGGPELLPQEPRSPKGQVIGFVDGHVECVRPERLDELVWEP